MHFDDDFRTTMARERIVGTTASIVAMLFLGCSAEHGAPLTDDTGEDTNGGHDDVDASPPEDVDAGPPEDVDTTPPEDVDSRSLEDPDTFNPGRPPSHDYSFVIIDPSESVMAGDGTPSEAQVREATGHDAVVVLNPAENLAYDHRLYDRGPTWPHCETAEDACRAACNAGTYMFTEAGFGERRAPYLTGFDVLATRIPDACGATTMDDIQSAWSESVDPTYSRIIVVFGSKDNRRFADSDKFPGRTFNELCDDCNDRPVDVYHHERADDCARDVEVTVADWHDPAFPLAVGVVIYVSAEPDCGGWD